MDESGSGSGVELPPFDAQEARKRLVLLQNTLADEIAFRLSAETQARASHSALSSVRSELASTTAEVEAAELRSLAVQGEDVRLREKHFPATLEDAAARIPLDEAVIATQFRLDRIRSLLQNVPEASSTSGSAVEVMFQGESCKFGLTASTTFKGLKQSACAHWEVSALSEMKDVDSNRTYFDDELCLVVLKGKTSVRLHVVISSHTDQPAPPVTKAVEFVEDSATVPDDTSTLSKVVENSESRLVAIRSLQKKVWEGEVTTLSPVFHDQDEGGNPFENSDDITRMAAHSANVWCWAVVLALFLTSMVFRFSTAAAFSSALEVTRVLGNSLFNSTGGSLYRFEGRPSPLLLSDVSFWASEVLFPVLRSSPSQLVLIGGVVHATQSMESVTRSPESGLQCAVPTVEACPPGWEDLPLASPIQGQLQTYYSSACQRDFPASEIVPEVKIAADSSMVVFDFNLLNVNLGWVVRTSCLAEVDAAQLVVTYIHVDVLPLSVYAAFWPTAMQPLLIASDVLVLAYASVLLLLLPRKRMSLWNLMLCFLWLCVVVQLCLAIAFEFSVAPSVALDGGFQNLASQVSTFQAYLGMCCASLFLLVLLLGKELQWDGRTSLLFQTLHRVMARNFASILFLFVLALSSMSLWANLAFGPTLLEWSTLPNSASLLAGLTFGAPVDFFALRQSQTTLFWLSIFFLAWVGFVFLVLVQLFSVAVIDAYLEVTELSGTSEGGSLFWTQVVVSPFRLVARAMRRRKRATQEEGMEMLQ